MVRRAPLWACLREAVAFVPKAWAGAWLALSLFALTLGGLLVPLHYDPFAPSPWMAGLWLLGVAVLKLASYGGLFRLALFGSKAREEGLGLGGLQLARPELRMLGGGALVLLFLAIVAVGLLVAVTLIAAAASGEDGRATGAAAHVVTGVNVAAGLVLASLYVRLSLFAPATVGRRRVVSLDALGLAQGAFWTLLFGLIVCLSPLVLGTLAASSLLHGGPESAATAAGLLTALLVFVQIPLLAGFLAAAYKRLEYADTML